MARTYKPNNLDRPFFVGAASVLTPELAVFLHLIAGLMALIFSIYYFRKIVSEIHPDGLDLANPKKWIKDALPFTMLSSVMVIDSNLDIIMLKVMTTNESVGIYRVASQTVIIVSFMLSALNMVVAPHITKLFYSSDMKRLQRMVTNGGRLIAITGVPIALMLMFWGDFFLKEIFGERFVIAAPALAILCLGQIVNLLMGINGTVLNMTKYASESAWILFSGVLVNIALNLYLIPVYGVNGAAIATASSLAFWNVLLTWRVYHHLKINVTPFS